MPATPLKTLSLELFKQTAECYQLRLGDKQRSITADELQTFINDSQTQYKKGIQLSALGQSLYDWLNGAEGWLQNCQNSILQIHHDSVELHEIPWELLQNKQNQHYLCAQPHQPFTPQYKISTEQQDVSVAPRPLRLLFMASSPENINPVLDFENEEALILEATKKTNLELIVEESGSLAGLNEHITDSIENFDVVHLTGHADIKDGLPVFLLENQYGQAQPATADEIATVFSQLGRFPRLLFLSGCKTAQTSDKGLPSLAAALVKAGVPAVLGWAKPVYDTAASIVAQKIYQLLAEGGDLARAVALARQALYVYDLEQQKNKPMYEMQWHLLRFYTDNTALIALAEKGRRLPHRTIQQEFLDKHGKIEVCPHGSFVGRRRLLQECIRVLRSEQGDSNYAPGVMLLGMGGLGKSSLAQRLCHRLNTPLPYRFIVVGCVNSQSLRQVFSDNLPEHQQAINDTLNQDTPLSSRLVQLLNQYPECHQALWVFDDFEQNFIADSTTQVEAKAYEILHALATAIHQTGSPSRLLITSRYALKLPSPLQLTGLSLSHFDKTDLDKKVSALRLQHLQREKQDPPDELETQAIKLSAGNPRLLEWLYLVLANPKIEHDALFTELEQKEKDFRLDVLLESILMSQSIEARQLCALLALFEIAMPVELIETWGEEITQTLQSMIDVGLIENIRVNTQNRYYVSRLLVPLLQAELNDKQLVDSYHSAAQYLYDLWWENNYKINDDETRELSRIAKAGKQTEIYINVTLPFALQLHNKCRYDEAHVFYQDLLPACRLNQDKKREGTTLNNISQIFKARGDYETALKYLEQCLSIFQEIGDKAHEGGTLNNISQIHDARGDYETALKYLEQSLAIRQEIGDKSGEGTTLNNMATTAHARGDYETALKYLEQSLAIRQEIGDKSGEGTTLNNISQIFKARGDYETALKYLEQSLAIQQEIGDKSGEGTTLNNMATTAHARGDYETALKYLEQCLSIFQEIGDKAHEGGTLNNISQIHDARGDYETALKYLEQSLAIRQEIGDMAGLCVTLFNIGHIHVQNKAIDEAVNAWLNVYKLAIPMQLAQALDALSDLAPHLGMPEGLEGWEALLKRMDGE